MVCDTFQLSFSTQVFSRHFHQLQFKTSTFSLKKCFPWTHNIRSPYLTIMLIFMSSGVVPLSVSLWIGTGAEGGSVTAPGESPCWRRAAASLSVTVFLMAADCKQQMVEWAPEQHVNFQHSFPRPAVGYSHHLSSRSFFWSSNLGLSVTLLL